MLKTLVLALMGVFASFGVVSCSQNPATGGSFLNLVGDQQALAVGKQTAQAAIQREGLYHENTRLKRYYDGLAQDLRGVLEDRESPLEFIILDSPTYNAWATPGYINMYRGIFPYFNSEAELVAVMAHEAGHIQARHVARGMTKGTLASLLVTGAAIGVGLSTDNDAAANLAYAVGGLGATVAIQGYSRAYEREADGLALRYMERMGYDPREAYNLFENLVQHRAYADTVYGAFHNGAPLPQSPFYDLLASHPDPADRKAMVVESVGAPDGSVRLPAGITPATPSSDPQGRMRYLSMIDGMRMGPKLEEGVVGRDVFYHPELQVYWPFAVAGYRGFVMQFAKDGWEGIVPNSNNRFYVEAAKAEKKDYTPEEALRVMFPEATEVGKLSAAGRVGAIGLMPSITDINGNSYADGRARVAVLPGPEVGRDGRGKDFLVALFLNWEDGSVRASLDQVRGLSENQANRIEALELELQTVQAGDSLSRLASRMDVGALQVPYFQALNGLDARSPLIPGMTVKLVNDPNVGRF